MSIILLMLTNQYLLLRLLLLPMLRLPLDLFTDYVAREEQQAEYEAEHARERKIQKTMLRIKKYRDN